MPSFQEKTLSIIQTLPQGKVTTYANVARMIGHPKAFRAVGNALHGNPSPAAIPCHRVIRSSGDIGGYILGRKKKEELLREEGVRFDIRGKVARECIMYGYPT